MTKKVSARPDNLAAYHAILEVVDRDLQTTAGNLVHALQTYRIRSGEFGADYSDLAQALGNHARVMENLDDWVGRVGEAFRHADRAPGHAPKGVVRTTDRSVIRDDLATSSKAAAGVAELPIPGPPGNKKPVGRGSGKHDSDPFYSPRNDDWFLKSRLFLLALAAGIKYPNASKYLLHYLGNSGAEFKVNPDEIMRDVGGFRTEVNNRVKAEMSDIAKKAKDNGAYGKPSQFSTDWNSCGIGPGESEDWYYAMDKFQYSVTGVATVQPPDHAGGEPRIEMKYRIHVFDRYNWDKGAKTDFSGIKLPVNGVMARLHRAGVAQEFDVSGSTKTKYYSGVVPQPDPKP
ncbi:MAG: hypothetical protein ACRDRQ_10940 [Pseudonocardiaceae bacterium]